MSRHEIDSEVRNSTVEYCINEYVRNETHRCILRDHWFRGETFEALAEKYNLSVGTVKSVIYEVGDPVLIRSYKIDNRTRNGDYGVQYVLKSVLTIS